MLSRKTPVDHFLVDGLTGVEAPGSVFSINASTSAYKARSGTTVLGLGY